MRNELKKISNTLNFIKKTAFLMMVILISAFLIACDYEVSLYNTNVRNGLEVVNVDLIRYNNQDDFIINEMNIFNSDYLEIIERLEEDKSNEFLDDLTTIGGISSKPKNNIKSPNGLGVLLTYEDNGFTIITVTTIDEDSIMYIGDFSSDSYLEHYESFIWSDVSDDFTDLLNDYFEY